MMEWRPREARHVQACPERVDDYRLVGSPEGGEACAFSHSRIFTLSLRECVLSQLQCMAGASNLQAPRKPPAGNGDVTAQRKVLYRILHSTA